MLHLSTMKVLSCLVVLSVVGFAPPGADPIPNLVKQVRSADLRAIVDKLVSFGTRHIASPQDSPTRGIGAAERWLAAELRKIDGLTLETQDFTVGQIHNRNVIGTLKGKTDNIVILSAHYDSRASRGTDGESDAPGANDDASGVAVVLQCARLMASLKPENTVKFIFFSAEESGLNGSKAYAAAAAARGEKIIAVLNNDIVGNSKGGSGQKDAGRIRVFSEGVEKSTDPQQIQKWAGSGGGEESPSRSLARAVFDVAQRYVPSLKVTLVYRRDRYGRGGDHISFNERGYAAIRLTETFENFDQQHQDVAGNKGDVPQAMDFDYLTRVAKLNLATVAELALAPAPPLGVRLTSTRPSYDTQIVWKAEPGVQYVIRWRETSSPVWQFAAKATGAAHTLKNVNKDDYIVGVQAVSTEGHRSVVVPAK